VIISCPLKMCQIQSKVCERTGLCAPPHGSFAAFLCAACASPGGFHVMGYSQNIQGQIKVRERTSLPNVSFFKGANRTLRAAARQLCCLPLCGVCIPRKVSCHGIFTEYSGTNQSPRADFTSQCFIL